jgi:acetyl esterase/lipase
MNVRSFSVLCTAMLTGLCGLTVLSAQPPAPASEIAAQPPKGLPAGVDFIPNLVYAEPDGLPQKLDLYLPRNPGQPVPLVVFVHGGGWYSGYKENPLALPLTAEGFAVASINYRLTPVARFPAQLFDCKAAIRWLRANSAKYHFDPNKIGAWGTSAGGHLVDLLGTTANHPELEGEEGNPGVSSAVQAVCSFAGPTNLLDIYNEGQPKKKDILEHMGVTPLLGGPTAQNLDKARAASAIFYVAPSDPPFLLVHGDHDPSVPMQQSLEFADALKKAGDDVTVYIVKGGLHVPRDPVTRQQAINFFKQHLQK